METAETKHTENFSRHFSRFYDEQKNSCIKYKGEKITEFFEGELDNLRISYEWNTIRYSELNEVFELIDALPPKDPTKAPMSEIAQHNLKVMKDWKDKVDGFKGKAFCMIAADKDGTIQVYSHFDNQLLAKQLRTVLLALEHGQKVIETELPKFTSNTASS